MVNSYEWESESIMRVKDFRKFNLAVPRNIKDDRQISEWMDRTSKAIHQLQELLNPLNGKLNINGDISLTNLMASSSRVGTPSGTFIIKNDGDMSLEGGATMWDDIRITPGSFDRPGSSDPTIVSYTPGGSGTATYLYQFAKNNIASFTVQMPHGYKKGSDLHVHIHWTPGTRGNEENGATVGWKIDYSWANIDGTFPSMSTADLSDACGGVDHGHQMTDAVVVSGDGKGLSSMLLCNVKRTDTGADDTWAGTASGQLPLLLEIDFHYEIDTIGSRNVASK